MGAVLGVCSAATCAANLACCCGSAACGLCCRACPSCKNSTSTRIAYSLFLLFGLITSCIVLIPGIRDQLDKIPHFCQVRSLSWYILLPVDPCFVVSNSSLFYILQFDFIVAYYFPLCFSMVMNENDFQTKEKTFKPRIILNHNICTELCFYPSS